MALHSWRDLPLNQLTPEKSNRIFKGEKIKLVLLNLKAGYVGMPHQHLATEQLSHILQGEVRIKLWPEEQVARAGDLIQIPINLPHQIICQKDAEILEIFSPPEYEKVPAG